MIMRFIDYGGQQVVHPAPFEEVDSQERPRSSHPYSYSPETTWFRSDCGTSYFGDASCYTDRLRGWIGYDKFREMQTRILGKTSDYWSQFKTADVEKFLQEYLGEPVVLVRMVEYCNQASGFPLWLLCYHKDPNTLPTKDKRNDN